MHVAMLVFPFFLSHARQGDDNNVETTPASKYPLMRLSLQQNDILCIHEVYQTTEPLSKQAGTLNEILVVNAKIKLDF